MLSIEEEFNLNLNRILGGRVGALCVGVSGGSDSMALLLLAKQFADTHGVKILAVTVDHMLRKESSQESMYVHDVCQSINVEHIIIPWRHDEIPSGKVEIMAREARYALICSECRKRKIDNLLVGHNLDEQLETFFLRYNMKSSEFGLACMSMKKTIINEVSLLRPCLPFTKQALRQYLAERKVRWCEDSMNADERFLRVKYRKIVNSLSPSEKKNLVDKIVEYGNYRNQVELESVEFLKAHNIIDRNGFAKIDIQDFERLTNDVKTDVLMRASRCVSHETYNISKKACEHFLNNYKGLCCGKIVMKKSNNSIIIYRENRSFEQEILLNAGKTAIWDKRFEIKSFVDALRVRAFRKCRTILGLPSYVAMGLPVFNIGGQDAHVGCNDDASLGFLCRFLKTEDFLDVFCTVGTVGEIL